MNTTQEQLTFVKLKYGIPDRFCYDAVEFSNHIQRLVPKEFLIDFGYGIPVAHWSGNLQIVMYGPNARIPYPYNSKQYTDQLLIDLIEYESRRQDALHP